MQVRKRPFKISPLSIYLREIIYGGSDGIVTTFSVVAGFTGASSGFDGILPLTFTVVLLFGLANLFADATSMGLGNFLSIQSEKKVYARTKKQALEILQQKPNLAREETIDLLLKLNFSQGRAMELTDAYLANQDFWVRFYLQNKYGIPSPETSKPVLTGLTTFLAFVVFGFVPLIPYLLMTLTTYAFVLSATFGVIALTLLGTVRWRTTRESFLSSVVQVVFLGSISGAVAYVIGSFF